MRENARKQGFGTRTGSISFTRRVWAFVSQPARRPTVVVSTRLPSVHDRCRCCRGVCESVGKNARTPILPYAPCVYEYSGAP
jgi:hypothetical protein